MWCSNSKLGADFRVNTNSNINDLVALPTARHHRQNLLKIDKYRYDFTLLEKTNNVFIRDRYGYVVYIVVKMRLINNPNLAMLVSIRKIDQQAEYAILDNDKKSIVEWTAGYAEIVKSVLQYDQSDI